jgi:drug/metabolite transporter (DMT)-like permease
VTRAAETDAPLTDPRMAIIAFGALTLGVIAMGASPIFVRLADVGPFASAFWRVALALPVLWAWSRLETRGNAPTSFGFFGYDRLILAAGVLFAGDLFFWHLAIMNTTVANATFLAALAPVLVVAGSWVLLREPISGAIVLGLAFGLLGAACLLGSSYSFAPENLTGDVYGLITACFFGAYILAVRPARRRHSAGAFIFRSTVVTALLLLLVALVLEPRILPASPEGLAMLLALALVSHVGGQGLLAVALGHLPAAFSSLVIFLEGVAAAFLGWMILREDMTWLQFVGIAAIFVGIWIARPRRRSNDKNKAIAPVP